MVKITSANGDPMRPKEFKFSLSTGLRLSHGFGSPAKYVSSVPGAGATVEGELYVPDPPSKGAGAMHGAGGLMYSFHPVITSSTVTALLTEPSLELVMTAYEAGAVVGVVEGGGSFLHRFIADVLFLLPMEPLIK